MNCDNIIIFFVLLRDGLCVTSAIGIPLEVVKKISHKGYTKDYTKYHKAYELIRLYLFYSTQKFIKTLI